MQQQIQSGLSEALSPQHLEVINESHMHRVPPNSETHFRVIIASDAFDGLKRVRRHQLIYSHLKGPLEAGVHALAIEAHTVNEWEQIGAPQLKSPPCRGGDGGTRAR